MAGHGGARVARAGRATNWRGVEERLPPACRSRRNPVRFLLSVEVPTIYEKFDRTRKIHHLIYAPGFDAAERVVERLSRIGNLRSDGRPIPGLDSRHLLEVALEPDPGSYLVPAHVWTPRFAALGSKSGFDAIDGCYGDLAPHVFAVETGLSSDPPAATAGRSRRVRKRSGYDGRSFHHGETPCLTTW